MFFCVTALPASIAGPMTISPLITSRRVQRAAIRHGQFVAACSPCNWPRAAICPRSQNVSCHNRTARRSASCTAMGGISRQTICIRGWQDYLYWDTNSILDATPARALLPALLKCIAFHPASEIQRYGLQLRGTPRLFGEIGKPA